MNATLNAMDVYMGLDGFLAAVNSYAEDPMTRLGRQPSHAAEPVARPPHPALCAATQPDCSDDRRAGRLVPRSPA